MSRIKKLRRRKARRNRNTRSTRIAAHAIASIEPLEPRMMLSAALLGVVPDQPFLNYDNTGVLEYDAGTGMVEVNATPLTFNEFFPNFPIIATHGDFHMEFEVDSAGNLVGGVVGPDLIITGNTDVDGNLTLDGTQVLLTGEITAFGAGDTGTNVDKYDFIFTITGGALAPYYAGSDLAIVMTSENSNYVGDFTVNFTGGAKGTVGSTPSTPTAEIELKKYVKEVGDPAFGIDIEKYVVPPSSPSASGDLCAELGKVTELTLLYDGGNASEANTSQPSGKFAISDFNGGPNGAGEVYIRAGFNSDPNNTNTLFSGNVLLGDTFTFDNGGSNFSSNTYIHIFSADGSTLLQTVQYHTSCSAPIVLGEDLGGVNLVGVAGENGQAYEVPTASSDFGLDADDPTGPSFLLGEEVKFNYVLTNTVEGTELVIDTLLDNNMTPGDDSDDFTPTAMMDGGFNVGDTDQDGRLDYGEQWLYMSTTTADEVGQFTNKIKVIGTPVDAAGDRAGTDVMDMDPANYIVEDPFAGVDLCAVLGEFSELTFTYNGSGSTVMTSQDSGKAAVIGGSDPMDAPNVFIRVTDKTNPTDTSGKIFFEGNVALGDTFTADNTTDSFGSNTVIHIFDETGTTLLQSVQYHTSCSQPIMLGDVVGAVQLTGYTGTNGSATGTGAAAAAVPTMIVTDPADIATSIEINDKRAYVTLTNNGSLDATIASFNLDWTTTDLKVKDLHRIKIDGAEIYHDHISGNPLSVSSFKGELATRLLQSGETITIEFEFEKGTHLATFNLSTDYEVPDVPAPVVPPAPMMPAMPFDPSNLGDDADVPPGPTFRIGSDVMFTYVLTTPTDGAAIDVDSLIDDNATIGDLGDDFTPEAVLVDGFNYGDTNQDGLLNFGETWYFTAVTAVTAEGQFENCAEVIGTDTVSGADVSDDDCANYTVESLPDIDIEKYVAPQATPDASGDLCAELGKVTELTLFYDGGNASEANTSQPSGKFAIADFNGGPSGADEVFIRASFNSDPNSTSGQLFADFVDLGDTFSFDNGGSSFSSNTYIHIFSADGSTLLQTIQYHTSCSAPIVLGEDLGGVNLVGVAGENGVAYAAPTPSIGDLGEDADDAPGVSVAWGDEVVFNYLVTNTGDEALDILSLIDDNATADPGDDFTPDAVLDMDGFNIGDANQNGVFDVGEAWLFSATKTVDVLGLMTNKAMVVAESVVDGEQVSDMDPANINVELPAVDVCTVGEDIQALTFKYTGDNVLDNTQGGKATVTGDAAGAGSVLIRASDKSDPAIGADHIWFEGTVAIGEDFTIDAAIAGHDKLSGDTYFHVFDAVTGDLLQTIKIHTSCSQPLVLGNDFGSIQLQGFLGKDGGTLGIQGLAQMASGSDIIASNIRFEGKTLKIDLTNTGDAIAVLQSIDLTWATGNKKLKDIYLGSEHIFDTDVNANSTVITSFKGHTHDRFIQVGETLTLTIEFEANANVDLLLYDLLINWGDGPSAIL